MAKRVTINRMLRNKKAELEQLLKHDKSNYAVSQFTRNLEKDIAQLDYLIKCIQRPPIIIYNR